jgi:uncharacterized membrane protein
LANVPAYLTRPAIYMVRPNLRATVERRLNELREIGSTTDPTTASELLRRIGVTFLVVLGQQGPAFDPDHSRADFRTSDAAVYWIAPKVGR